jgi:Multiubiquitin
MAGNEGKQPPLERAVEGLEHAEADLARAQEAEARAEHKIEEAFEEIKRAEHDHPHELIINRKPFTWPKEEIDGRQIKELAGSPADWVVNQIVDGPGEDPDGNHGQGEGTCCEGLWTKFEAAGDKSDHGYWRPLDHLGERTNTCGVA